MMNLSDFCFWGVGQITSFSNLVCWLLGSFFELYFLVWVLNIAFSFLKKIILHLGGVRGE